MKHGIIIIFSRKEKEKLLTTEFKERNKEFDADKCVKKVYSDNNLSDYEKLQELYLKTYLPALFIAEDKMTMASGLEARTPICDNEMLDFSLSTPIEEKLKNEELKYIIKEGMRGTIPDIPYKQEKRGFPTPFGEWLKKKEVQKYIRDIILSEKAIKRNIYKKEYAERLLKKRDFLSQNKIWCLLNIEMWHRKFID